MYELAKSNTILDLCNIAIKRNSIKYFYNIIKHAVVLHDIKLPFIPTQCVGFDRKERRAGNCLLSSRSARVARDSALIKSDRAITQRH